MKKWTSSIGEGLLTDYMRRARRLRWNTPVISAAISSVQTELFYYGLRPI